MFDEIEKIFQSQTLEDLIIVGYSDNYLGFKRFNAMMNSVFLVFEDAIIRLETYEQYSKIKLSITVESAYDSSCVRDENDELMLFSALELYTRYEIYGIGIEKLKLFYDDEFETKQAIFRAIGINLAKHAGYLFFDPMNLSGILIGSMNQEEYWLENWEQLEAKNNFAKIRVKTIEFKNSTKS